MPAPSTTSICAIPDRSPSRTSVARCSMSAPACRLPTPCGIVAQRSPTRSSRRVRQQPICDRIDRLRTRPGTGPDSRRCARAGFATGESIRTRRASPTAGRTWSWRRRRSRWDRSATSWPAVSRIPNPTSSTRRDSSTTSISAPARYCSSGCLRRSKVGGSVVIPNLTPHNDEVGLHGSGHGLVDVLSH